MDDRRLLKAAMLSPIVLGVVVAIHLDMVMPGVMIAGGLGFFCLVVGSLIENLLGEKATALLIFAIVGIAGVYALDSRPANWRSGGTMGCIEDRYGRCR